MTVQPRPLEGRPSLELVSHCWSYLHLLECQLGSLVASPPAEVEVTMTVYFCREDERTTRLLELAEAERVPNLRWSWRALPREQLYRRSIGRNHAALRTEADWTGSPTTMCSSGLGASTGWGRRSRAARSRSCTRPSSG